MQIWPGTLPINQVRCYVQIPGRDKDLLFVSSVKNRLEIKNLEIAVYTL
jgi:hypothetical protein